MRLFYFIKVPGCFFFTSVLLSSVQQELCILKPVQTRQSHFAPTKQMSEQHKQDNIPNIKNNLVYVGVEEKKNRRIE